MKMIEMDTYIQTLEAQKRKNEFKEFELYSMSSYCNFLVSVTEKLTMIFPVNMYHFVKTKATELKFA